MAITEDAAESAVADLLRVPTGTRRRAPGPGIARLALMAARVRDPFRLLDDCVAKYGDFYSMPLGPGGTLVVNDPDHVASWLLDYSKYHKGVMSRALVPALGESIPVADGEPWKRSRKALNPAFSRRSLNGLAELFRDSFDDSLARWDAIADSGEEVDIYRELSILTMAALQRSMFSSSVSNADVPELVDLFRVQTTYMGGLMLTFWGPSWLPAPGGRAGKAAVTTIRKRIEAAIADRRANPTDTPDVLNTLLALDGEDGATMDHENLVDQLMGLWFGGFDTTASALAWSVALLAQNPDALEALHAEADAYTGNFDAVADLNSLPYSRAAFDEAQRLQGALLLTRQALEDDEINGYFVPKGSQVGVSAYTLGRHSGLWDKPLAYDPMRWLDHRKETMHKFQFLMFGGGPRHCIGSGMAYLEAQFVLTKIAQRYYIQPRPGWAPRHDFHLSTGLKGGVPGRIIHRQRKSLQ
ncbi:Unspecific monooxygenase [Mycolicibacterium rhodesiae JS60]|nr:Unspecific monooxygenase [Mycolicibacterium rhodesiae JS60]